MAEEMPVISGDRATLIGNLLTSMIGAGLLGIIVAISDIRLYAEPISESVFGPLAAIANAILFVVLATVGATFVVLLLKYGKEHLLRYLLIGAFTFISIVIVAYFGYLFLIVFQFVDPLLGGLIGFAFAITSTFCFIMVDSQNRLKNGALLVFGSGVGAFLGVVLPVWTSVLLLVGLAIYDYYSVKKGPIRKIVELTEDDPDKLTALSVSSSEWDIGLGDVAFYGMITVLSIVNFGFLPAILAVIGVVAGFLITLRLLEKRGIMAGLPIPIALGLIGLGIGILLRWVFPFLP
ncbi:MAG: presenilin family intramembrane aspartyl protease [Candidatus Hodarchaeota archaeon]